MGRSAVQTIVKPQEHRKNPYDPMVLQMPIDQFLKDQTEQEGYKQLTSLTVNKL